MSSSSLSRLAIKQIEARRSVPWRVFAVCLAGVDAFALGVAFVAAYWLRYYAGLTLKPEAIPVPRDYVELVLLIIPAWLFLFAVMRLYDRHVLLGGTEEYMLVFNACTTGIVLILMFSFLLETIVISRAWLIMAWGLSIFFAAIGRLIMRRIAYRLRNQAFFVMPALIIGANDEAYRLVDQFWDSRYSGLNIRGVIAQNTDGPWSLPTDGNRGVPILGTIKDLPDVVKRFDISEIIVASTALKHAELLDIFDMVAPLSDVELRLSSGLYEVLTTGMQVNTIGSVPLMTVNRVRLDRTEKTLKAILDYTVALLTLLLLSPVILAISLAVRFTSPGPVIHRRRVMGMGGKTFDAFKFRTMYVNGDEILDQHPEVKAQLEAEHKLREDPRVTRVGRILRATSLDELPQLLNVLLGQMSLVGPRMITTQEANEYGQMRHNLLTVKPGITGLWQVSGRSDLSYDERVRLDMYYIRNYSIWLDLQILFIQTPAAVFSGRGAY